MQAYLLFTAPALFIMTSEFYYMLSIYKINHKLKWIFNLIMILLVALPIRYTIERAKPFEKTDRNPQWVTDLKTLNDKKIDKGVLFNYDNPVEAMFYTDMIVYPGIPDQKIIIDLQQNGYNIIINDKQDIPDDIKILKGVSIEKLSPYNK